MPTPTLVALPDLAGRFLAAYPGASVPTYRKLDEAARDGRLPIVRVNGRRFVQEDDLPAIAAQFSIRTAD